MNTQVLLTEYLDNEEDWKILDTYYVIASMRITRRKNERKNQLIQVANSALYPSSKVLVADDKKDQKKLYFKQLDTTAMPYFATLIKGSIKKGYDFVFLNTKKEEKLIPYMEYISEFLMKRFGYPMYDYHKFNKGKEVAVAFDEHEVLFRCNRILREAKYQQEYEANHTKRGRMQKKAELLKKSEKWSKPKLRKKLAAKGFYCADEDSKEELLELYQSLL